MAASSVAWIHSVEDPDYWYLEFVFETDKGVTFTHSYSRMYPHQRFVEIWPKRLAFFSQEPWFTEDKRSWI